MAVKGVNDHSVEAAGKAMKHEPDVVDNDDGEQIVYENLDGHAESHLARLGADEAWSPQRIEYTAHSLFHRTPHDELHRELIIRLQI